MNMQITTLKIKNHTLDYDGIRHYLITHSFIGWLIATTLRKKYNIPSNNTSEKWFKRLKNDYKDLFLKMFPNQKINSDMLIITQDIIEQKMLPEINKLAEALKISEKLLRTFVIYDNVPYKINGPKLIYHASPLSPIVNHGTYIRMDEKTTNKDVNLKLANFKKWQEIKRQVMNELKVNVVQPELVKSRKKQIEEGDELAIQDYLAIENAIINLFQEKASPVNYLSDDGYVGEIVKPALENVAGDSINSNLNDTEFDKQFRLRMKELKSNYYTITRRYALPTSKKKTLIFELMSL